jgi:putative transposase
VVFSQRERLTPAVGCPKGCRGFPPLTTADGNIQFTAIHCQYMYNHGFRSVYKLNAHIVLVVKYRRKAINAEILNRLKEIITDTFKKWDCELLEFNGVRVASRRDADHVHLLIDYKPDKPLSTLIGNIKTVSSRLIRK